MKVYMFQEEYTEIFYIDWVKSGTINFIGKGLSKAYYKKLHFAISTQ